MLAFHSRAARMEELAGGAQQAEQLGAAAAQEVLPLVGGGETDGGGVPVIDGAGGDGGFGMPDGQGGASVVMTANQQVSREIAPSERLLASEAPCVTSPECSAMTFRRQRLSWLSVT